MARTKARRMAAARTMDNLHNLEAIVSQNIALRGKAVRLFAHDRPLVVELGCGKAESLIAMATHDPSRNYLGVDLKSARLWSGAEAARRLRLEQVQLLLAPVVRLPEVIAPESASEIWIPFPDPVARGSKAHKRLVSPEHLGVCWNLMEPGAHLHVKSDDPALFAYALRSVQTSGFGLLVIEHDLYASSRAAAMSAFMSTYERRFVAGGRSIGYLCARKAAVASASADRGATPAARGASASNSGGSEAPEADS